MNALRIGASRLAPAAARTANGSLRRQVSLNTGKATVSQLSQFTTTPQLSQQLSDLGSVDHGYTDDRIDKVAEPERRAFTYLLLSGVRFAYASTARVLVVKFVSSMSASADVLALASAEFDVSALDVGKTMTVKWRGKPVFIRHRTQAEIDSANAVSMSALRDPESDEDRVEKP